MSSELSHLLQAVSHVLSEEDSEEAHFFVSIDSVTRPSSPCDAMDFYVELSWGELSTVTRPASPILLTRYSTPEPDVSF
jgi:hypothetical protein